MFLLRDPLSPIELMQAVGDGGIGTRNEGRHDRGPDRSPFTRV